MKLGIEVPIPDGNQLWLSPRLVAGIVEAAFNDTNGGCKHWLSGPVTGGHTASPAESGGGIAWPRISTSRPAGCS